MNKKLKNVIENKLWLGNIHNRPVEIDEFIYKYNPVAKKLVLPEIPEAKLKNKDNV